MTVFTFSSRQITFVITFKLKLCYIFMFLMKLVVFFLSIALQEECVLSDPQGESDADADIEDTDCRFDAQKHTLTSAPSMTLLFSDLG